MAGKEVANEDLKVNFTKTAPPDAVYAGDQPIDAVKIVAIKATKTKANNKFVCANMITLTFTAGTPCPHTSVTHTFTSGAGSINATAIKTKVDNLLVLRKDDPGTCVGSWINTQSGLSVPCSCTLKISDAGQTKVLAE